MSASMGYPRAPLWDGMPEETIEDAEAQLSQLAEASANGITGWLILFAAVASIIGLMLLYLWGRYRRADIERASEVQSPLFDEITQDTVESELVFAEDDATVEAVVDTDDPVPAFETIDEPDADDIEPAFAAAAFADVEKEPVTHETDDAPAEAPRYPFAEKPLTAAQNATFRRDEIATPPPAEEHQVAEDRAPADAGAPYIAPFIREDIDRAEQRQSERLDMFRDEITRNIVNMKIEQASRLDLVIGAIDRKLESLDHRGNSDHRVELGEEMNVHVSSLGQQVDKITSSIDGQGQRIRAITSILENRSAEITQVYDELKSMHGEVRSVREDLGKTGHAVGAVKGEIDEIKENVGKLERAILDRAAQESSTIHRLTDVIRGTLPDGTYTFGAQLANDEAADCLISFEGLREKVAIDAGFPMEAFHELPSRDAVRRNLPQAKAAEDAFRRAILRSILEAADRCISPAETADSCLLFLPSEAAYTILHDRFPDLVRDSQRARVWLVSPSTLMGTLNLIRNLIPDAETLESRESDAVSRQARYDEEERLRREVDTLRGRANNLSHELDRTRATLRDLIGTSVPTDSQDSDFEEVEVVETKLYTRADDDEIIEGLRFDGTPEWESPRKREQGASLLDDDRPDPLR